jgi:hypothetical protein
MIKVGEREFPHTKQGQADAKAYAKRTGKKIHKSYGKKDKDK